MKTKFLIAILAFITIISACRKKPELESPPTITDAAFTYTPSPESDNILVFTANKKDAISQWDFGNNTKGEGISAKGVYPYKGTYTVTHSVFTNGGNISTTSEVVIANDDFSLLSSPEIVSLTGGIAGVGYKTWVIDSSRDGHFGVGPHPASAAGLVPEWYSAKAFEQATVDMYNDRYTFHLQGFKFDMKTQGVVFIDDLAASEFPGSYPTPPPADNYNAPLPDQLNENWNFVEEDGITYLTTSGKSFIGFYAGVRKYQVLNIEENELSLRYVDANASGPQLAWYLRLVPEDYQSNPDTSGGPDPVDTNSYNLPIDFETIKPVFSAFDKSTDSIIPNPFKTGINTSDFVLESEKGDQNWSGVFVNIKTKFDFSTKKTITLKVYAPKTGKFLVKLEDQANSLINTEVEVNVTQANTWEEISADFSAADPGKYNRLTLIPGWNEPNSGTYYIDDIDQK